MSTDTNYDLCQRIKPYVILCDIDLPCIVDFSPRTRGSYSIELVFLHEFQSPSGELYSIYHYCDKVCQWLPTGWWFSRRTPISSTYKTDHNDIAEILLKVALNTKTLTYLVDDHVRKTFIHL
jgi:hypothetical protein